MSNFIVIELIIFFIAFTSFAWGMIAYRRKNSALSWNRTDGEIVERFNRVRMHGSGSDVFLVTFKITYRYIINGVEYLGSEYCAPEDNANSEEELNERMKCRFAIGARIPVYFAPDKPKHSSLHRTQPSWYLLGFLISLFCILFGMVYYFALQ